MVMGWSMVMWRPVVVMARTRPINAAGKIIIRVAGVVADSTRMAVIIPTVDSIVTAAGAGRITRVGAA
jgi:hypothetical protein